MHFDMRRPRSMVAVVLACLVCLLTASQSFSQDGEFWQKWDQKSKKHKAFLKEEQKEEVARHEALRKMGQTDLFQIGYEDAAPFRKLGVVEEKAFMSVSAKGTLSSRSYKLMEGNAVEFQTIEDLTAWVLTLPPNLGPPLVNVVPQGYVPPPGGGPTSGLPQLIIPQSLINIYNQLLVLIHTAYGPTSVIQPSHLIQATQTFYSIIQATGTLTPNQALSAILPILANLQLNSPAHISAIVNAFSPVQSLQSSANYRQLLTLVNQATPIIFALIASPTFTPGTTGGGGGSPPLAQPFIPAITLFDAAEMLRDLINDGDPIALASQGPGIIKAALGHVGFKDVYTVLWHRSDGTYQAALVAKRFWNGEWDIHVVNKDGYQRRTGVEAGPTDHNHQGVNDDSFVKYRVKVNPNGEVRTKQVEASNDYHWGMDVLGGNRKLLERAVTRNISVIKADLGFFENENVHIIFAAGATPRSHKYAVAFKLEANTEVFEGHIGIAGIYDKSFISQNYDRYQVFVQAQGKVRTPYLTFVTADELQGLRLWASITASVAGIAQKSVHKPVSRGKKLNNKIGYQGDALSVGEVHIEYENPFGEVYAYGGVKYRLVPDRRQVDLEDPINSLNFSLETYHVGMAVRFHLTRINKYIKFKKAKEEGVSVEDDGSADEAEVDLLVAGEAETSLVHTAVRGDLGVQVGDFYFGGVLQNYSFKKADENYTTAGVRASYQSLVGEVLQQVGGDDTTATFNLDFGVYSHGLYLESQAKRERSTKSMEAYIREEFGSGGKYYDPKTWKPEPKRTHWRSWHFNN